MSSNNDTKNEASLNAELVAALENLKTVLASDDAVGGEAVQEENSGFDEEYGAFDAESTGTTTVDQARIGMTAQPFVGEDGKTIYLGDDNSGFPILVAAHPVTGKIWLDAQGRQVVVNPAGRTYVRYEFAPAVRNPEALKFTPNDINDFAAKRIAQLSDGFVSFLEYLMANPPKDPAEVARMRLRPFEKFNKRLSRFAGFALHLVTLFVSGVMAVERFINRIRFRKQNKNGGALQVQVENVDAYLNQPAKDLLARKNASLMVVDPNNGEVYEARNLAIMAPLGLDGNIKPEYLERFSKVLNTMAIDGTWKRGILAPPSSLFLAMNYDGGVELRYEKALFAMIYVKNSITDDDLNQKYANGQPLFVQPGNGSFLNTWRDLPF